ncbi:MAG: N-6 DNA methylase [Bacteroidales bacterium]|jgi:type I restriction enzyme M protein|nr:N-6 DNA methylase [Bacteroidales bacterium]
MTEEIKEGYIHDYVSGVEIKATPEEIEAVQVYSKILVEDYEYPKNHLQTRPQWRVKVRPSDNKKEYPVDIVIFENNKKEDGAEIIIVECKKRNRKDGRTQLEDYLRFSRASIGVWFNGDEKLFLKKSEKKGKVLFEEIPNIPKYGEKLEDIGLYKRKDLKIAHNLKSVFKTIRNYLAANAVGITRDEVFAQQIINVIFCKIYDERFTKPEETVNFRAGIEEDSNIIANRIKDIFEKVKTQYGDVIEKNDRILLDDSSLTYVVGELQIYSITQSERDAIADAFETFIGPSLKGGQGQFFTPRNIVRLIIEIVNPSETDKVIDPACGSGGFLVEGLRHVWRKIDQNGKKFNWPDPEIYAEKQKAAIQNFRGIDKDNFLSKVAKAYMAIIGDGRGGVFCENSLENFKNWKVSTRNGISIGEYDVVVTNPPFGKKLKIDDIGILTSFNLGHKWKNDKKIKTFELTNILQDAQAPQILFVERCLELLKDGAKMGFIAPESMFCNPSHRYIVQYIKSIAKIKVIISLPEELFQPYTHAKTCLVVLEKDLKKAKADHEIFMAVAKWCGHDSRGLEIPFDDIPKIQNRYNQYVTDGKIEYDHLGFTILESHIKSNVYLPKYYNPEMQDKLKILSETHDLVEFKDLVKAKIIRVSTGDEVGKLSYGTGNIPFIRTSDIANWEIKSDPKQGLSNEIYESLREKQDVCENDVLMVRDGTYLVGTCAIVTKLETKILYQSHLYKIRSLDPEKLHPYLLLALLSAPIVKEQIAAKRFTQDIIDTLGERLYELVLPIPKNAKDKEKIIKNIEDVISYRIKAKEIARTTILELAPDGTDFTDEYDFLTMSK